MKDEEYKTSIRLLRRIAGEAINLKNEFHLADGDIHPILALEEQLEEILTTNYCNIGVIV